MQRTDLIRPRFYIPLGIILVLGILFAVIFHPVFQKKMLLDHVAPLVDSLEIEYIHLTPWSLDLDNMDVVYQGGRFQLEKISLLTITANPSIGYRVTDWLSVGAGFQAMYADMEFKLAAPPINPPTGGDGRVKVDGNDWAFGYNFGALFELSPRTRVGVTYVSKIEPSFDGDLSVKTGAGAGFSADSELKFTFPQLVRVGAYHELNEQWALLGTVGWEDWSSFDSFEISTDLGGQSIETDWKDTYHFSGGVHYRPTKDWLLQAGITYDTSPVSNSNRSAEIPMDRQIRYAVGVQHQFTERMSLGGSFEYIDLGNAKISSSGLQGDYQDNRILAFGIHMSYTF